MGDQADTAGRFQLFRHKNAPFHENVRALYHERGHSSIDFMKFRKKETEEILWAGFLRFGKKNIPQGGLWQYSDPWYNENTKKQ